MASTPTPSTRRSRRDRERASGRRARTRQGQTRHHAQVAFLNVLIVMQDWDFPDFSEGEIKISALDIKALKFEHCFEWLRKHLPPIYVSGKWVNYLGVLMGMGFDWGYWFMTTLPFRPCDYAQLWESKTHNIYTLSLIHI